MNLIFCNRMKELRSKKGMGQEQVAHMIGIGKASISQYENGAREPSLATLVKLAHVYHVTTDYLLGCEEMDVVEVNGLSERMKWLLSEFVEEVRREKE